MILPAIIFDMHVSVVKNKILNHNKLIIMLAIHLFFCFKSYSQPNPGFENWSLVYNCYVPDDWQTLNALQLLPPNPLSVTRATGLDVHSGNYAAVLKTIHPTNNPMTNLIEDTIGIMFTGVFNYSPLYYKVGFPYTSRPEKLTIWYKYLPLGNDTARVRIKLTKATPTTSIAVGENYINLTATPTYTKLDLPINYYSDDIPDTCAIVFLSSYGIEVARVGSALYIDDVELSGWVGIKEQDERSLVKIYPNPAKDNITFFTEHYDVSTIRIVDIAGKLVGDYKGESNQKLEINTQNFAEGTYIYMLLNKNNKILCNGKFNIIK